MSESPADKPQTWLPLVLAGLAAATVVVGLLVMSALRVDLAPVKQAAVDACEAAYTEMFPDGPGITAGEVFSAQQWREYNETLRGLGYVTQEQIDAITAEQAAMRDEDATALVITGADSMTVVWQRDDQTHAMCEVDTQGDTAVLPVTKVGILNSETVSS